MTSLSLNNTHSMLGLLSGDPSTPQEPIQSLPWDPEMPSKDSGPVGTMAHLREADKQNSATDTNTRPR